ncbi:MAG: FG-GAP repeat domain-containing protein [bacterium]
MISKTIVLSVFFLCTSLLGLQNTAYGRGGFFDSFDLPYSGEFLTYHAEDLNNDQLTDILIFTRRRAASGREIRWLSVFIQQEKGFRERPNQTFKIPENLILYDTGNIAGDASKELIYFTTGELQYFALQKDGFDLQPRKLFSVESIFMLSDRKTIRQWDFVKDFNHDGLDDIFIQQITKAIIFFQKSNEDAWQQNELPLSTESRVFGFYDPRFSVGHKSDAIYSTPYILLQDFNIDGRKDLLGIYKDSLVVFYQNESGLFDPNSYGKLPLDFGEIWRGAKIQRTHLDDKSEKRYLMRIKDINNDSLLDIVSTRLSTKESLINPKTEVHIHYGKINAGNGAAGVTFRRQPDQVVKPEGSMMVLNILDINSDKRDDLIIPFVKIGVSQIIKMLLTRSVSIEAAHYLMQANSRFPEKPDGKNTMNVKFSFKGGAASPVYEIADFNGDGFFDVLGSSDEQRLLIYWGDKGKLAHSSVGEKFSVPLPQDGTLVRTRDLNADKHSDVIIAYNEDDFARKKLPRALRILLARR